MICATIVALCLPERAARLNSRSVLTELGPDSDAIRPEDRDAILFDQGLSLPQCDFCIRTSDPALLKILRANAGLPLFDPNNSAGSAILKAHPHRITITKIGRVEVYQKIGGPDTGGVSPEGPHTHLLPQLMRSGRTHSAITPIPAGLIPLGYLHPGNPVIDPMGVDQMFDETLFLHFDNLLTHYGNPDIVAVKTSVLSALAEKTNPEAFDTPSGRFGRAAFRLTLRQQERLARHRQDMELAATVSAWRGVHDSSAAAEEEDDAPGH